KFDAEGNEITYTVVEEAVPGYATSVVGTAITNTLKTIDLNGTKNWVGDEGYETLTRPASIIVKAMKGETVVKSVEVTPDENGDWSWTIEDLPKFDAEGNEITYTVVEEAVPGYNASAEATAVYNEATKQYELTNTVDTTEVTVKKVWDDLENAENTRPESIEVQLSAADSATVKTVTLNEENNWTYTWKNLPKYKADGKEIAYSVDETAVPGGYVKTIDRYTIKNTYVFGVSAKIAAQKVLTGIRNLEKDQFTFELKAGEKLIATAKNDAAGNIVFADQVYSVAGVYKYTISEVNEGKAGYTYDATVYNVTVTVTQDEESKQLSAVVSYDGVEGVPTFENAYTAEAAPAEIKVVKQLAGVEGKTGPGDITGKYTFTLEAVNGAPVPENASVTNAAEAVSFGSISYDAPGTYEYTVKEAGYVAGIVNDAEAASGKTVTVTVADSGEGELVATVNPAVVTFANVYTVVNIAGEKTWDDMDNKYGTRPESINIILKADGEPVGTQLEVKPDDAGRWEYSFAELPMYSDANGTTEIVYTVEEEEVTYSTEDGLTGTYVATVDNYNICNRANIAKIKIEKTVTSTAQREDGKYALGETIKYQVTITNTGNQTLENIKVSDTLVTLDGEHQTIESLGVGDSYVIEYDYVVTEADVAEGTVHNAATATVPNGPEGGDEIDTPVEPIDTTLTVTKTSDKEGQKVGLGETINYTITVKNDGNVPYTNVVVTDELTGDEWTIAVLAVGEVKEFTAAYTVTSDDILAGKVINSVTGKGDPIPDPDD
ncbi:MAG: Cna B-type domain-containing protein, partial [Oscillospiraceae bacterium]|nr:Cna B-type domain-containing protein [Oscillospiraceae bacterium]